MSMKNSSDTIGNRNRDLPACSAVPQPTAPPRAPGQKSIFELRQIIRSVCVFDSPKLYQLCVYGLIWDNPRSNRVPSDDMRETYKGDKRTRGWNWLCSSIRTKCVFITKVAFQNTLIPSLSDDFYREWEYFSSLRCDAVARRHIPEYLSLHQHFFCLILLTAHFDIIV